MAALVWVVHVDSVGSDENKAGFGYLDFRGRFNQMTRRLMTKIPLRRDYAAAVRIREVRVRKWDTSPDLTRVQS
jgi:hypothetical protein